MPMDEEMVYKWVHKQSSWSIAFFAVVLAVVTWGIAAVLVQGLPALAGGCFGDALGAVAGVAYGVASTAMYSGGGIAQAQKGFFGSTGNGVFKVDLGSMSVQSKGLAGAIQQAHLGRCMRRAARWLAHSSRWCRRSAEERPSWSSTKPSRSRSNPSVSGERFRRSNQPRTSRRDSSGPGKPAST